MEHNYYSTLISAAPDYEGEAGTLPKPRGSGPTVAQIHYELLVEQAGQHTQAHVLFESWLRRQDLGDLAADEVEALRIEFFSKGQPCLRTSPLTKTHGWGVIFDGEGRATAVPSDSEAYRAALEDPAVEVRPAMRSKRR